MARSTRAEGAMTLPLVFGYCTCHVWTLVAGIGVSRCGRCRTRPQPAYYSKREAMDAYIKEYNRIPPRMVREM
jgi:hypothetical protein